MGLDELGYEIIEDVYSKNEIDEMLHLIKSENLDGKFGEREILIRIPKLQELVFNRKLTQRIKSIIENAISIKSIYFDKPPNSNWIVNWHQDLTINIKGRIDDPAFKNWRNLETRTVVQPPLSILENIFTIRIHLDDCNEKNGALRVCEKSHNSGVILIKNGIDEYLKNEKVCEVQKGGILIMKPLILHSSRRTENKLKRRVLHIEFTNSTLPQELYWNEKINFNN